MCTPWTMTRNIKWRVRDWTSTSSPWRFPLGDHELTSTPQMRKNMTCEKKRETSVKPIHNKNLSPTSEKCNKKRHINNLKKKEKEGVSIGNRVADEDYIVFSFREDGAFDVVQDCKGVTSEAHCSNVPGNPKNLRPVNRKLDYGEGAEQVNDNHIQEKLFNANQRDATDQHDQDLKEYEEKETISMERTSEIDEIEDHELVSSDSRNSNQSEGSRGSFAFPVLGWEWIESPVKMPKSEDLHLKKHKLRCIQFQCLRF